APENQADSSSSAHPRSDALYNVTCETFLDVNFRLRSRAFHPRHFIQLAIPARVSAIVERWADQAFCTTTASEADGELTIEQAVIDISPTCVVHVNSRYHDWGCVGFVLATTIAEAEGTHQLILNTFGTPMPVKSQEPTFRVIALEENHVRTHKIPLLNQPKFEPDAMDMHYGAGFSEWVGNLHRSLERKASSFTILQGPPGTGKTSFLRWLIANTWEEVDFYFVPLTCFELLSNPNMTNFWLKECAYSRHPKVLIIEDAEMLLMRRRADNGHLVGNLLNITDGLMGDALRFHIISSINCPLSEIDPALLRSGRLSASWVFRPLEPQTARQLATILGRPCPNTNKPITLADIYGAKPLGQIETPNAIGFHSVV
ncbi:MAG: AAA family ATPase, partial [Terrimicrobiaceae bacterium]